MNCGTRHTWSLNIYQVKLTHLSGWLLTPSTVTGKIRLMNLEKFPLLDQIVTPADLRKLDQDQFPQVADELRECLLQEISKSGGHFSAGLGCIELTVALHYCFETPHDRIVWDVGHQAYPHKILTGRRDRIGTIKKTGGLAPFPKRAESEFDTFGVGHSSTSISAGLGMALASVHKNIEPARCIRYR